MDNIFSVQYEAKGSTEFLIPFAILNEKEIQVFVNNNLQNKNNYIIKSFNQKEKKVIFHSPIGSVLEPKVVTIEKISLIERKTDFKDFTEIKAENLNLELNNIISVLKSLQMLVYNSVQKSKLEDKKNIIVMPNIKEGKGLYWGKGGELLNTDQNVNDLLNELAQQPQNSINSVVLANKVKIKTNNTHIKKENLQEFLEVIDSLCFNINAQLTDINKITEENTNKLNGVTTNINNILPEITNLNSNIKVLQDSIKEIKETIGQGNNSNSNSNSNVTVYGVINCPKRDNKQGNYLVPTKEFPYRLNIVNITADNPLVLSFGYKGKNVLFKGDSLDKFEKPFCNFFPEKAGRYYIRGEYKERTGKLNLIAHKSRPFFGYERPTHDVLINHGCVPEDSDYFLIKDLSFYGGRGQFKNKPALYIYLGHVNLNDNGEVVSDVVLYSEQKYFESYIDVHPNGSYCIPNLIGSNAIDIKIFGLYERQILMNVCNQGKLNKDVPHVLEMGTNFHYNLEEIFIHTGFLGALGYYRGDQLLTSQHLKLKVEVRRTF